MGHSTSSLPSLLLVESNWAGRYESLTPHPPHSIPSAITTFQGHVIHSNPGLSRSPLKVRSPIPHPPSPLLLTSNRWLSISRPFDLPSRRSISLRTQSTHVLLIFGSLFLTPGLQTAISEFRCLCPHQICLLVQIYNH
jgi:hypothetical protein